MSEGALPVAEVGTREGETSARHRRGADFQGIRILYYGLSEPIVQGRGKKGVCPESRRGGRKILRDKGAREIFFTWRKQEQREKISKRLRLIF